MANTSSNSKVVPLKPKAKKAAPKPAAKKKSASKPKTTAKKKVAAKKAAPKPAVKKVTAKKAAPKKAVKKVISAAPKAAETVTASQKKFAALLNQPGPKTMEKIMAQNKNQFDQFTKDASAAGKEGVDAFVKSGTIFAKGMEEIIRESMSFAQTAAEKQAQFAKDAMSAKTINEWSDIQNKIAQENFDDFMSGFTKLSELGTKIMTDAIDPINKQMTKAAQKAGQAVAAE